MYITFIVTENEYMHLDYIKMNGVNKTLMLAMKSNDPLLYFWKLCSSVKFDDDKIYNKLNYSEDDIYNYDDITFKNGDKKITFFQIDQKYKNKQFTNITLEQINGQYVYKLHY